jgi:hypothetical protein
MHSPMPPMHERAEVVALKVSLPSCTGQAQTPRVQLFYLLASRQARTC